MTTEKILERLRELRDQKQSDWTPDQHGALLDIATAALAMRNKDVTYAVRVRRLDFNLNALVRK
jgi:hypothetical protein